MLGLKTDIRVEVNQNAAINTSSADVLLKAADASITSHLDVKHFPRSSLIAFSRNLRRLRHREKMTQEMIAERLDITPRHYQKLEAATVTPTFGVLIRCKRVLRASWENLLGGV